MDHGQPTDNGKRHRNTRFMEISFYLLNRFYGLVLCISNKLLNYYKTCILLTTNISNRYMLLKNYKNAHQPKSSISKNARLLPIYYICQNNYIINCLQKLCNSKALLLICYFQILPMHLYNKCCHNCAYSKINSLQIWTYLNKHKRQIYSNG